MKSVFAHLWGEAKAIINHSSIPEDPLHAKNTLYWLLRLCPGADEILRLAAFAHDIERAISDIRVKRKDFPDYDSFKMAHAKNSAKIMAEIIKKYGVSSHDIKDVEYLIIHHEIGGCKRSDLIKDADSLSFFDVNLAFYEQRNKIQEVIERCIWGCKRISPGRKRFLEEIMENKKEVAPFIEEALAKMRISYKE